MWLQTFPDSWTHVKFHTAVLPSLCSFLKRNGSGGSLESLDAVLPFVGCIPAHFWEGKPDILIKIFKSIWAGAQGKTIRYKSLIVQSSKKDKPSRVSAMVFGVIHVKVDFSRVSLFCKASNFWLNVQRLPLIFNGSFTVFFSDTCSTSCLVSWFLLVAASCFDFGTFCCYLISEVRSATLDLMVECLQWGLTASGNLSSAPSEFQDQLITGTFSNILFPSGIEDSNLLGKNVIRNTLARLVEVAHSKTDSLAGTILTVRRLFLPQKRFYV